MPGYLLNVNATAQCTHLAPVAIAPAQTRVLVSAQPGAQPEPVATANSALTVGGCPFQVPTPAGPKPQPCVRVQWSMLSTRVLVMGQPVLLQPGPGTGPGICESTEKIQQGPPNVNTVQMRVTGM